MSHEPHQHHHGDHHNFAEANEHHFDAQGFDILVSDEAKTLGRQAAQAFLNATEYDKEKTVVLDFACGTGELA